MHTPADRYKYDESNTSRFTTPGYIPCIYHRKTNEPWQVYLSSNEGLRFRVLRAFVVWKMEGTKSHSEIFRNLDIRNFKKSETSRPKYKWLDIRKIGQLKILRFWKISLFPLHQSFDIGNIGKSETPTNGKFHFSLYSIYFQRPRAVRYKEHVKYRGRYQKL